MKNCINKATIKRLQKVCDAFSDQGLSGYPCESLLIFYSDLLRVREDMRQQADPIGGRYICAEDRYTVMFALDALHSAIMRRYDSCDYAIWERLEKLLDYLRQAVE